MLPPRTPDPLDQVRRVLLRAGFNLLPNPAEAVAGLQVSAVAGGVEVSWQTTDTFTAIAGHLREPDDGQPEGAGIDSVRTLVNTAVAGLLIQAGLSVTQTSDSRNILVITD